MWQASVNVLCYWVLWRTSLGVAKTSCIVDESTNDCVRQLNCYVHQGERQLRPRVFKAIALHEGIRIDGLHSTLGVWQWGFHSRRGCRSQWGFCSIWNISSAVIDTCPLERTFFHTHKGSCWCIVDKPIRLSWYCVPWKTRVPLRVLPANL